MACEGEEGEVRVKLKTPKENDDVEQTKNGKIDESNKIYQIDQNYQIDQGADVAIVVDREHDATAPCGRLCVGGFQILVLTSVPLVMIYVPVRVVCI